MSQHDLTIANQGFPAFRADLNSALQALGSCQSGTSAPSPTFANQLWYDTTNNILKIRNEDNDAWISVVTLDQTTDAVTAIGSLTLADIVSLTGSQTLTNKTLTNPTINGFTGDTSVINIGSGQVYKDTSGNLLVGTTSATPLSGITATGQGFLAGSRAFIGTTTSGDTVLGGASGSNFTDLYVGGASNVRLNTSGTLVLKGGATGSTGTGISFPATQSASGDANTLDDYEEGNWTPTFSFSGSTTGITYAAQDGRYTKVGRVVTLQCYIQFANKGSASGGLRIEGMPFTSQSGGNNYSAVAVWGNSLSGTIGGFQAFVNPNQTYMAIYQTNTGASSTITNTNCGSSTDFMVNVTYVVA